MAEMITQETAALPTALLFGGWLACATTMALAWGVSLKLRFMSLVDAVWALGIGICGASYLFFSPAPPQRSFVVGALLLFWSFRLGFHLILRLKAHYPTEDSRYTTLRQSWQSGFLWKSFLFFQFQALLQIFFAFPFALIASQTGPFPNATEVAGLVLVVGALLGEATADRQLKKFKSESTHRGKVCNVGLWRFSRHPNYFFEWLIWCGFALMALAAPMGWLAVACPALMLFLLLYVTGVAPSEAQALKSRGEAYRHYQRTTSRFIPWFPKGEKNVG